MYDAADRAPDRSIGELLGGARRRLRRLGPAEAFEAIRGGALLVDIRPQAQRAAEGLVPGALHVERNVLEWRFDPGGTITRRGSSGCPSLRASNEGLWPFSPARPRGA